MKTTKYIVVLLKGEESIFTFPGFINHDRMYEALETIRLGDGRNWNREFRDGVAVSAGFVINGTCQGKSETLRLRSREEIDTKLLG